MEIDFVPTNAAEFPDTILEWRPESAPPTGATRTITLRDFVRCRRRHDVIRKRTEYGAYEHTNPCSDCALNRVVRTVTVLFRWETPSREHVSESKMFDPAIESSRVGDGGDRRWRDQTAAR